MDYRRSIEQYESIMLCKGLSRIITLNKLPLKCVTLKLLEEICVLDNSIFIYIYIYTQPK